MVRLSLCLTLLLCTASREALATSYAEVFAGVAFPSSSGSTIVRDREMTVGNVGTSLSLSGVLRVAGIFSVSPSATFISTSARAAAGPASSSSNLEFRQNDAGLDLLVTLPRNSRVRLGAGAAFAWWNAAYKSKIDYDYDVANEDREFGADSDWMFRCTGQWMLRDPRSAGVVLKAIVAVPLSTIDESGSGFASGYAGLGIGFSLPLNE